MKDYKDYVRALKEHLPGTDFTRMYERIEQRRSSDRHRTVFEFAAAGVLAAALIALLWGFPRGGDYMSDYVLKDAAVDGSPMVAYVFSE